MSSKWSAVAFLHLHVHVHNNTHINIAQNLAFYEFSDPAHVICCETQCNGIASADMQWGRLFAPVAVKRGHLN